MTTSKEPAEPASGVQPRRIVVNNPIAAMGWVTTAMMLFAVMAAAARVAMREGIDPLQLVFFRNLAALIMLAPLLAWRGTEIMRSRVIHLYWVRVGISLVSMTSWFYALSLIPIGELTAIGFLAPLFGTLCAIVFLGEKVRIRRWAALIIGFMGAMIILRPGAGAVGLGQGLALVSAFSAGMISILLKHLTSEDDPEKIVFLTTLMMTPLSLAPALFVWTWPGPAIWPPVIIMTLAAVLGHLALVRGFRATEASLVLTFEFSRLPFAIAIAYWMFGEMIDKWSWIGAIIIFASAVYITRREARLRREKAIADATRAGRNGT